MHELRARSGQTVPYPTWVKYDASKAQHDAAVTAAKAVEARYQASQAPAVAAAIAQTPTAQTAAAPAPAAKPRYIAVDVPRDDRAKCAKNVMVWDTQEQAIVGNSVCDLKEAPQAGQVVKLDTIQATYIGSSN